MSIGNKIKKIRELNNYTQEYLANKLNMSLTGYGKIERNEVDIQFSRLQSIASVFKMSVAELITFDENVKSIIQKKNVHNEMISSCKFGVSDVEIYKKVIKLLEEKIVVLKLENLKIDTKVKEN